MLEWFHVNHLGRVEGSRTNQCPIKQTIKEKKKQEQQKLIFFSLMVVLQKGNWWFDLIMFLYFFFPPSRFGLLSCSPDGIETQSNFHARCKSYSLKRWRYLPNLKWQLQTAAKLGLMQTLACWNFIAVQIRSWNNCSERWNTGVRHWQGCLCMKCLLYSGTFFFCHDVSWRLQEEMSYVYPRKLICLYWLYLQEWDGSDTSMMTSRTLRLNSLTTFTPHQFQ